MEMSLFIIVTVLVTMLGYTAFEAFRDDLQPAEVALRRRAPDRRVERS